jgi:hypothetical protein
MRATLSQENIASKTSQAVLTQAECLSWDPLESHPSHQLDVLGLGSSDTQFNMYMILPDN